MPLYACVGTYAKGLANSVCTDCEPGKYQTLRESEGQAGCEYCPPGSASNKAKNIWDDRLDKDGHPCDVCGAGNPMILLGSKALCFSCNASLTGKFANGFGNTQCQSCGKGLFVISSIAIVSFDAIGNQNAG